MEILNTYQELSDASVGIMTFGAIGMLIGIILGIGFLAEKSYKIGSTSLVIASIIFITLGFNYNDLKRDTFHEITIKNITEFDYEKYEIVEQRGKVLTIMEVEGK